MRAPMAVHPGAPRVRTVPSCRGACHGVDTCQGCFHHPRRPHSRQSVKGRAGREFISTLKPITDRGVNKPPLGGAYSVDDAAGLIEGPDRQGASSRVIEGGGFRVSGSPPAFRLITCPTRLGRGLRTVHGYLLGGSAYLLGDTTLVCFWWLHFMHDITLAY